MSQSESNTGTQRSLSLHPDALYNQPYEEFDLDLSTYQSGAVEGVFSANGHSELVIHDRLVQIEAVGDGMLRL